MKKAKRSPGYIFRLWGAIAVVSGMAAVAGFLVAFMLSKLGS
jgi:hypothetical protein